MAGPPSWLIGVITAIAALAMIGFDFALFASSGGIVFAGVAAFWIGAGVAALIDPRRASRNAMIVAMAIAASTPASWHVHWWAECATSLKVQSIVEASA